MNYPLHATTAEPVTTAHWMRPSEFAGSNPAAAAAAAAAAYNFLATEEVGPGAMAAAEMFRQHQFAAAAGIRSGVAPMGHSGSHGSSAAAAGYCPATAQTSAVSPATYYRRHDFTGYRHPTGRNLFTPHRFLFVAT